MKERLDREVGIGLKRMLVGTGVTQGAISAELGLRPEVLSRILSGNHPVADGFPDSFRAAFDAVTDTLQHAQKQARQQEAQAVL